FFFFFSSRRRHTRCYRDWSSDVCSSDLLPCRQRRHGGAGTLLIDREPLLEVLLRLFLVAPEESRHLHGDVAGQGVGAYGARVEQIGRASCRGRDETSVEEVV